MQEISPTKGANEKCKPGQFSVPLPIGPLANVFLSQQQPYLLLTQGGGAGISTIQKYMKIDNLNLQLKIE